MCWGLPFPRAFCPLFNIYLTLLFERDKQISAWLFIPQVAAAAGGRGQLQVQSWELKLTEDLHSPVYRSGHQCLDLGQAPELRLSPPRSHPLGAQAHGLFWEAGLCVLRWHQSQAASCVEVLASVTLARG